MRTGQAHLWTGERRRTTPANWREPLRWDRKAERAGVRAKVFCASLADVFDNQVPGEWRADLFSLIRRTPNLDWLLLTKRPQNIGGMLPPAWGTGWHNVWLGTTAENQPEMNRRSAALLKHWAVVHFFSCEPMLSEIVLPPDVVARGKQAWVICGGESGYGARPMHSEWARSLRDQCRDAGVPFFMKQMWGPVKAKMTPIPDDLMVREMPA